MQPDEHPGTLVSVRRLCSVLGLMAAVGLLAGCDVGSIRRPAPPPTPPATPAASSRPAVVEVRQVRLPVAPSFILQTLAFVDSTRGYALYARCGEDSAGKPGCEAALFATLDGGRSWSARRHPHPFATNQQLVVNDNGGVMLLADPYGWYLSRDNGLTFRRTGPPESPPVDYYSVHGGFQVWNSGAGPGRVVEYVDRQRRELPVQPPLGGRVTSVEYDEQGRLWAAGIAEDGRAAAALSRDRGQTWQRQEVPGQAGRLESVWLEISAGGGDVWLLGQPAAGAFPSLWRFDGGRGWRPRPASGHPARALAVAPVGGGALAVALPDGAGLVTHTYWDTDWPLAGAHLKVLADGTLMAAKSPPGVAFLGLGHGVDRHWVQVRLESGGPAR